MKKFNKVSLVALLVMLAVSARAAGTLEDATASFTSGITGIAALVGSLAAIGAGVALYRKIKGYFGKTS